MRQWRLPKGEAGHADGDQQKHGKKGPATSTRKSKTNTRNPTSNFGALPKSQRVDTIQVAWTPYPQWQKPRAPSGSRHTMDPVQPEGIQECARCKVQPTAIDGDIKQQCIQ